MRMKQVFLLSIVCLSGCQEGVDVKKEWIDMLSTNGISVVFAMFCIFIIVPAIGLTIWKIMHWIGKRIDKLLDAHYVWMDRLVSSNEEMSEAMHPLVEKISNFVDAEPVWHQRKFDKLTHMHDDIKTTHTKVTELHNCLVHRKTNND